MDQHIVSGLYDFPAREYNGLEGRWPSPDPAGLAAVNPADPQTWNRYAYVRNSPLALTDPLGLCGDWAIPIDGGVEVFSGPPCGSSSGSGGGSMGGPSGPRPCTDVVFWRPRPETTGCGNPVLAGNEGSGKASPTPQTKSIGQILTCASDTANVFSLAGLINVDANAHPLAAGVTNGFLGNTFSGVVDTGSHMASFISSSTPGQKAMAYLEFSVDLALGGAAQGLPGIAANNVWGKGIAGTATDFLVDATTAAPPVLSLTGEVVDVGAEGIAGPIGWGKLAIDGLTFLGSAAHCAANR